MPIEDRIVICIPTKRPPPIRTLESYAIGRFKVIISADPAVFEQHCERYDGTGYSTVHLGPVGLSAQCANCYNLAFHLDYPLWFKMDDDLAPKTFIHKDGHYPDLDEVIFQADQCMDETHTTLVGFHNGANRSWMKNGFGRTWGLIHGGANLSVSAADPSQYITRELSRGEDVWRTLAHREVEASLHGGVGYNGRVQFIGFDKSKSTAIAGGSVAASSTTQEKINASREAILARFPGRVSCKGTREIFGGKFTIPNWRMHKGKV
jgi:hypothetical protein